MSKDIKSITELETKCQEYKSEYEWLWNEYCKLRELLKYGGKN